MICARCKKYFNSAIPERYTENYGNINYYACPYCGKLHRFKRIIVSRPAEDNEGPDEADDWGNKRIKDSDYIND